MVFPYEDIEVHLLENGYDDVYDDFMPDQKRSMIEGARGDAGYWSSYDQALPGRTKTRAAAAVAAATEQRGNGGVTVAIRDVLERVALLARGA